MHRYQEVAHRIQSWINAGILRPGDRVQSVREMSLQTGYSMVTVHHAYALLESEGVLTARPRSGFFVAEHARRLSDFAEASTDFEAGEQSHVAVPNRLHSLMATWRERRISMFGDMYPSADLMPTREMKAQVLQAFRNEVRRQENPSLAGEIELRELIAKRATLRGVLARADDVVIASGSQRAMGLCLDAIARPGGVVLIETPSYFPLHAALQRRQINVMEVYSNPISGIDPDQFDHLLDNSDIQACILMPTNHYPTGVTYSEEVMRRIVAKASSRKVPVLELDLFGDLSYGPKLPATLKSFDDDDIVIQVGSFASTLGPAFSFGWIISQNFRRPLLQNLVFNDTSAGDAALQSAIAHYLQNRSFDRHLRQVRAKLEERMRSGLAMIAQSFPQSSAVSKPTGGYMSWVRLPSTFDAVRLSQKALQYEISLPPGPLFSVTGSFRNFLGLNLSYPTEQRAVGMAKLLELLASEAG